MRGIAGWVTGIGGSLIVGIPLAFIVGISKPDIKKSIESAPLLLSNISPSLSAFIPIKSIGSALSSFAPHVSSVSELPESTIRLGIPQPGAVSDQLYTLKLPERILEQKDVPDGWRASLSELSETKPPKLTERADHAIILQGTAGWDKALLTSDGTQYKDIYVMGLFDDTHAAVVARDNARRLLSVSSEGDIRRVATIEDTMQPLFVNQGSAWFVKAKLGQTTGSCLQGPSILIRIDESGTFTTIASDERMIKSATDGPDGAIAYSFDSGEMQARAGAKQWSGKGKPLVWIDGTRLLIAQNSALYILDVAKNNLESTGTLPSTPWLGVVSS